MGRLTRALVVSTRDPELAGDLAAEAFTRALLHWNRISRKGEPTGWLFTVAFNELRTQKRREAREGEAWSTSDDQAVGYTVDLAVPNTELWEAVKALPERSRVAIALRYVADLTEREVGEIMGITRGTVASTLSAARRALANDLQEQQVRDDIEKEMPCPR